jgi:tetratricopeptide (TPR) repeat protein
MESKALAVVTPRAFRSGEKPFLKISTRNIEKLTFTAYKLSAEAYFRKKQSLGGVESLDIGLVAPDAEWTAEVPGYSKFKPVEIEYTLDKVPVPGVHVVKVTDEKELQATTLVLGSDLDAILKVSRDQLLLFAQDMKTGSGRPNARVLVASGDKIIFEGKTGDDGVLLADWPEKREPGSPLSYLVLDGSDAAGTGLDLPGQVAQGLSPRAYLYTDRPAYRPGQTVSLRGVVREVKDGQYDAAPGATYKLEVVDSRGRRIVEQSVSLSDFGTFHLEIPTDPASPVGTYAVRVHQPGKSSFAGSFEIQSYQLQKVELELELPRTVYFRGEKVEGKALARYQYGTPLADRRIVVNLPDGRVLDARTGADGSFPFSFETTDFGEEQALPILASLPEEGVNAGLTLMLAVRAFRIDLSTSRDVYLDDESIRVTAKTFDTLGEPTTQKLKLAVLKRITQKDGSVVEREVETVPIDTDAKGDGAASVAIDDEEGGSYLLRASGTDRFGNPILADRFLTISGSKDENRLRLLADRQSFKVGEKADVRLHNRTGDGPALLTWEADRVLHYQIVGLKEGDNPVSWQTDGAQFPNFTLTASRMAGDRFHEARLDVALVRDLTVTIAPSSAQVGPGQDLEVVVTTLDQLGKPVPAEVSLALVDRALLNLYGDKLPPIGPFFYDQSRVGAFSTQSSNTFRYAPPTVPVSEAVVEEQERLVMEAESDALRQNMAPALARMAAPMEEAPATNAPAAPAPAFREFSMMDAAGSRPQAEAKSMADGAYDFQAGAFGGVGGGGHALANGEQLEARDAEKNKMQVARKRLDSTQFFASADGPAEAVKLGSVDRFYRGLGRSAGKPGEPPRQQFVETAYWNPSVVTGTDGKATLKIKAPSALSKYRFTARGVTGADTLAGQSTADLSVQQDFFVELKTPSILTQGDKPRFQARVHHKGIKGPIELSLRLYAGGSERVEPKTVQVTGDGVSEVLFDAYDVPDAETVELTLTARAAGATDRVQSEVPIRPWGVQALATASGTASNDATVFVQLPEGRPYERPELQISLSPSLRRMVVELALGPDFAPLSAQPRWDICRLLPPPSTVGDRASDLLAATFALNYVRSAGGAEAPEATRLTDRARSLASELVALQNEDGGWPWVTGKTDQPRPSDPLTSARALWALSTAAPLGLLTDPSVADRAVTYVEQEFAKLDASDLDGRAALLHALSTRGRAAFEQANRLNRDRQNLPDSALAYLALTFANLDRANLGAEVLDILGPRSKTENAAPGSPTLRYWEGNSPRPSLRGPAEATALAALAYSKVRPASPERAQAVEWLIAHRAGLGWNPGTARGPALGAFAAHFGQAGAAADAYRLTVTVNDQPAVTLQVDGPTDGQVVRVPREALDPSRPNRVKFDMEGRGSFAYAVTLSGFARDFEPEQDRQNREFIIDYRMTLAPTPELDGKLLPVGFGVAVNPEAFENTVTSVGLGGRARIRVQPYRLGDSRRPAWQREFLVLEEYIPAGTTLVPGSVDTAGAPYEYADGLQTVYYNPDTYPGPLHYDVFGYLPGSYRALPARIFDAYDPGRRHLGSTGSLRVLDPGQAPNDPYKPTPDELYARGKTLFDSGRLADAAAPLGSLWDAYTLRDDVAKDAARMLLKIHIAEYDPRKVVRFFEILREKSPELVIPFDEILVVGRAYRDIEEFERAYLVWMATAEASHLEDARVGEVLRQQGKNLEGIAFLLSLWRDYPNTASIESDFFAYSQLLGSLATRAGSEPAARRELAAAGLVPPQLLAQSIRLIQVFLALSPKTPIADEASLALVNAFLDLGNDQTVVDLSQQFTQLYPKSKFLDSFLYSEALGRFHLGQYDRAIAVAETISKASYKDANGADVPSPNKWQALYILGQIHHARREPAKAIEYYKQVMEQFTDAAGAVAELTRTDLKLPEVTVIPPTDLPRIAAAVADPGVVLAALPQGDQPEAAKVELDYRNIAEADVKVYPVDLMRLYLTRRNLDKIAGIDLAGITPLVETQVKLGDGGDYEGKKKSLPLPLKSEGAYLVMVRGDDLYSSGIALVTPLELEVLEEADAGRVRVTVRDSTSGDYVPKVLVKVIGSDNQTFFSGETDLRGVFVAEGVRGTVTTVARKGTDQYAFHRGTAYIGSPPAPAEPASAAPGSPAQSGAEAPQTLDQNLKMENFSNQLRQIQRLEERYKEGGKGVQVDKAY